MPTRVIRPCGKYARQSLRRGHEVNVMQRVKTSRAFSASKVGEVHKKSRTNPTNTWKRRGRGGEESVGWHIGYRVIVWQIDSTLGRRRGSEEAQTQSERCVEKAQDRGNAAARPQGGRVPRDNGFFIRSHHPQSTIARGGKITHP